MSTLHKISVIGFFLVSISFFIITTGILAIKEEEKATRIKVEEKLSQVQGDLSETQKSLHNASWQLTNERKRANELAEELAQGKKETERLNRELAAKVTCIDELRTELESKTSKMIILGNEKEDIAVRLAQLGEEKNKLNKEITDLQKKMRKHSNHNTINLGEISVLRSRELTGTIMVVNEEFNFVVINLGFKDKISKGTMLFVYRGDELAGKVEIDRVSEDMSSADILLEWEKMDLKAGDQVKTL